MEAFRDMDVHLQQELILLPLYHNQHQMHHAERVQGHQLNGLGWVNFKTSGLMMGVRIIKDHQHQWPLHFHCLLKWSDGGTQNEAAYGLNNRRPWPTYWL